MPDLEKGRIDCTVHLGINQLTGFNSE